MASQTGPRVVTSNSCKGPVYPGKWPKKAKGSNENFGASKCYLEPNFSNLSPKEAALKLQLARVDAFRVHSWNSGHCYAIILRKR